RITGRVRRGIVLHPRIGPAENHDVPRTRIGETVSDLVDEDPVRGAPGTAVQRLLHRARRDHVHPGDELLDEKRQYERDDDEDRQLFPEGTLLGLLLRLLLLLRALGRSGALDTSESAGSRAPEGGGSPDSDEAAFGNAFVS